MSSRGEVGVDVLAVDRQVDAVPIVREGSVHRISQQVDELDVAYGRQSAPNVART